MAHLDDLAAALSTATTLPATIRPAFFFRVFVGTRVITLRAIDPAALANWCERNAYPTTAFVNRANSYRTGMGTMPGQGAVLVTRESLNFLENNSFQLVMQEEDDRAISIGGLSIDRSEAIYADYDPEIATASKTSSSTVYLVHLVDRRDEKDSRAVARSYNLVYGDNFEVGYLQPNTDFWTVKDIIEDLASEIGWPGVNYANPSDTIFTFIPEGYRFLGVNGQEALNSFLHAYQMRMSVSLDGQLWIVPSTFADTDAFDQQISLLNRVRLVDQKGFDHEVTIPQTVKIYYPNRDFQFQLYATDPAEPVPLSPEEVMGLYPFYVHDYTPAGSNSNEVHHLWGALPRTTDDVGQTNEDLLQSHGDQLGNRHVQALQSWDTWKEFTYTGLVPYEPTGPFSGVAWWDFGGGMFTKLYTQPPDYDPHTSLQEFSGEGFIERVRQPIELATQDDPYPSAPDVTRKHPVGTRLLPGVCTESPGPVNINEEGDFAIYFGIVQGTQVSWNNFLVPITAFPFFANMNNGARCLLHYNWQLGSGGRWVAIGFQAGSTQQGPSAYALADSVGNFLCSNPEVTFENLRYLSPDPNSLPWPGPPTIAVNKFGLAGSGASELLLMYDRTNSENKPLLVQVSHTCEVVHANGVSLDQNNCRVIFPTVMVEAPFQSRPAADLLQLTFDYMVKSLTWDNDTCSLYYQRVPVCYIPGAWPGTVDPIEGVQIFDLRNIRESCLPCNACPCDCASFDSQVKLTVTPMNIKPSDDCPADHPDPFCPDTCNVLFCYDVDLDETTQDDPDVANAPCAGDPPDPTIRVWKGEYECPGNLGTPNGLRFILCCDMTLGDRPKVELYIEGLGGEQPDQPLLTAEYSNDCECWIFEDDLDFGGTFIDPCGCVDPGGESPANCRVWYWVNMKPSVVTFDACESLIP